MFFVYFFYVERLPLVYVRHGLCRFDNSTDDCGGHEQDNTRTQHYARVLFSSHCISF